MKSVMVYPIATRLNKATDVADVYRNVMEFIRRRCLHRKSWSCPPNVSKTITVVVALNDGQVGGQSPLFASSPA